jgi:predicted nucleotidyltransferase
MVAKMYTFMYMEAVMDVVEVRPVHEARAELTRVLRDFRDNPATAQEVVFGAHRSPEAVIVPYRRYLRIRDAPRTRSLREQVHEQRRLIMRLARANLISDVNVFGSVARGEDTADSDLDLLIDPEPTASLFDFAQFQDDIETLTGRSVDVVSRRSLDPRRDAAILAEARPL